MHLMYFTEQPMSAYDSKEGLKYGATALTFSNKHFDPVAGSRLYNEYLEQYVYAEEMGVDGIMLNEHHNAPFCMQAKANIFAAILAGMTKKVKIVMLGNPLPLAENPIRLAEELTIPNAGMSFLGEKGIVGSYYGSTRQTYDMPWLMELYRQKRLKIDELISKRWELGQINEAYDSLKGGEVNRSVIMFN